MKKREKRVAYILRAGMTVLTIILIILFFGIMSLVSDLQGTAMVVNYAGLVRGEPSRVIKLEMSKEPDDEMIATVERSSTDFVSEVTNWTWYGWRIQNSREKWMNLQLTLRN